MTARLYMFLLLFSALPLFSSAQTIEMLTSGQAVSIRGLCPVNDNVIWVSGSKGTVGRSLDGGKTWSKPVTVGSEENPVAQTVTTPFGDTGVMLA